MPHPVTEPRRIAAIICAAGSGTRFGTTQGNKLDADLQGKPVLLRAVEAIASQPEVVTTIVAGPADPNAMAIFLDRHGHALRALGTTVCPGGKTERFETVQAGLKALRELTVPANAVLIHDAARPCVPTEVVRRVIDALATQSAVVPAVAVADTLKRAEPLPRLEAPHAAQTATAVLSMALHQVGQTIDRRGLFACQTPQGFHLDLITRAYAQGNLNSTDDAQLVERLGETVMLVAGDPRNMKITRPEDLAMARAIWPMLHA